MFNLRSASISKCIATNCRQRPYVFATIFDERIIKTVSGDGEPEDFESRRKGVNQCSKYVTQVQQSTQVQQQRPESPTVTLTWHALILHECSGPRSVSDF